MLRRAFLGLDAAKPAWVRACGARTVAMRGSAEYKCIVSSGGLAAAVVLVDAVRFSHEG